MDLFSFGFVLLILAAGGVIAYLADKLGKKIGKKKLSLRVGRFSLRPRHVAELGTVVMGILVALLTILLVAAASSDARAWLREGRHLLTQRDQLLRENDELSRSKAALQKDYDRFIKVNRTLGSKNTELRGTNTQLAKSLEEVRVDLASAKAQRQNLQIEAARLVAERNRLGSQVADLKKGLAGTRVALQQSQGQLEKERAVLRKAKVELKATQAKIATVQKDLAVNESNLADANRKLNEAFIKGLETFKELSQRQEDIKQLESRITELVTSREKAEQDLATAQSNYATTQAQLESATKDLAEVQSIVQSQQQLVVLTLKASRTERVTFKYHEEVWRITIPGGSSYEAARSALSSLLRSARVESLNRGAKGHRNKNQTFEAADVFDRQNPDTGTTMTGDELKASVINRVARRVEDQVLVATSSYNAFAGEPVSLDIAVFSNPVIYHKGEMLSEARIDGSLSEDRIFAQLSDFVRTRVRERAQSDGMIPRAQTDAPFGEISTLDVLNVLRDVKKIGRAVRVQAFASEDIQAAEPLKLEFRLR